MAKWRRIEMVGAGGDAVMQRRVDVVSVGGDASSRSKRLGERGLRGVSMIL
jgi:hypothetical protein